MVYSHRPLTLVGSNVAYQLPQSNRASRLGVSHHRAPLSSTTVVNAHAWTVLPSGARRRRSIGHHRYVGRCLHPFQRLHTRAFALAVYRRRCVGSRQAHPRGSAVWHPLGRSSAVRMRRPSLLLQLNNETALPAFERAPCSRNTNSGWLICRRLLPTVCRSGWLICHLSSSTASPHETALPARKQIPCWRSMSNGGSSLTQFRHGCRRPVISRVRQTRCSMFARHRMWVSVQHVHPQACSPTACEAASLCRPCVAQPVHLPATL